MNYGNASNYQNNGELFALSATARKLSSQASKPIIFDIGANVGHYTRLISLAYKEREYELYAFEPSLPTYLKLTENCAEIKGVHFNQLAMGDHDGEAILYYEKEKSGLSSLYQRDLSHRNIQLNTQESVQLTTLDSFCSRNQITHIHFLKMDVEGHELTVLKGADRLLKSKSISIIQFEFGGCNIDSKTNFRDFYKLLSPDYKIYRILNDGLHHIAAYSEYQEIYISANYLAVLKGLPSF